LVSEPGSRKVWTKCYYVLEAREDGVIDDESDHGGSFENDWVFIAIKEEDPVSTKSANCANVESALATQVIEKDEWVIDSRCSLHMTSDKSRFVSF